MQRSNRLTAGFPLLSPFGCETLSPHCRARAEGEGEMIDNKKSGDPGLSAAERKELREREAQEAIADLEEAQRAFHENRERLREERLGGRRPWGRCSIRRQSFRTTHPSKTSDFPPGSGTR